MPNGYQISMLFQNFIRTNHDIIQANESEFDFLDRCAWPKAQHMRSLLEQCLNNYPVIEQPEIIARLKSGDPRQFTSTTFELLLHQYLIDQNFTLSPHPELANDSAKRPDFLVTCPDGNQFYLEAICTSESDGKNDSTEALKESTLNYLNSKPHPNFFLSISCSGDPLTQPSGKKLYSKIKPWLDSLDPDIVLAESEKNGYSAFPQITWVHEEWEVTIDAIPLKSEYRGTHEQLIGIRSYGASWINGWIPIRDAIQKKTNRYGQLDLPLIVAVNFNSFRLNQIDELQALFGEEKISFNFKNLDNYHYSRVPNGAWIGPSGPKGRRCSGAWLFGNLSIYSLTNVGHTLYINPWSNFPLPSSALIMPNAKKDGNQIKLIEGKSFRDVFNLSKNWPNE